MALGAARAPSAAMGIGWVGAGAPVTSQSKLYAIVSDPWAQEVLLTIALAARPPCLLFPQSRCMPLSEPLSAKHLKIL